MLIGNILYTVFDSVYFAITLVIGRIPIWFILILFMNTTATIKDFFITAAVILTARAMLIMNVNNIGLVDFVFNVTTKYIIKPVLILFLLATIGGAIFFVFYDGKLVDYQLLLTAAALVVLCISLELFFKKKPDPNKPAMLLHRGVLTIVTITALWCFALYYITQHNFSYAYITVAIAYLIELFAHTSYTTKAGIDAG